MNNNAKAMFLCCGNGFNLFKMNLYFLCTFPMFCKCLMLETSGGREQWAFIWGRLPFCGVPYSKEVWEEGRGGRVAQYNPFSDRFFPP